ncbi:MAG: hypothetical protein V4640_09680 [Verrucomicrobiota bacterium]
MMKRTHPYQTSRRALRFTGPIAPLLQDIASGGPLYVHARNRMAELASIVPLADLVVEGDDWFFPDGGANLSATSMIAVHAVELNCRTRSAMALEIATPGEPRTLSIVASPDFSDVERFTRCLNRHPAEMVETEEYQQWRDEITHVPVMCPCCKNSADERRANPERNPLTRIFCHAIENRRSFRCRIVSPVVGVSAWLRPGNLRLSGGFVSLMAEDGRSMLEVDLGVCHLLRIERRLLDAERFTEIQLYDSLGELHLTLATRGWQIDEVWRKICS